MQNTENKINNTVYEASGDLMYTIVATPYDYYCDFKVYECAGKECRKDGDVPIYNRNGYTSSGDYVYALDEAEIYLSGSVKWDGCSNLTFDAQENCILHFCGRKDIQKVGKLLDKIYDIASELIPNWNAEVAT